MIFRHEYTGGSWIDLEKPTAEEIRQVATEFGITERLERELISPNPTPLVSAEEGKVLLVLHFPTKGDDDGEPINQEIDFIVAKNLVLTVHYEIVSPLHHLKKLLETQQFVEGKTSVATDVLLEILFAHLYTSLKDHTNHVANALAHVEKAMFSGSEKATVRAISNISREFLHMEAALANQEDSLGHFFDVLHQYGYFGPTFVERSQRIYAERRHVSRLVQTHRAMATELRETNIALLESRQNEIMKTLTTITVIVLPLELITFVFAMHLPGTPLEESPFAFAIVMGIMFGSVILTILYFAWKRWLF